MRRFLRWKWLFRSSLVLAVLSIAVPLGIRYYVVLKGQSRLEQKLRELDENDPGWTSDELCTARNARLPSPDRNSFTILGKARGAIPDGFHTRKDPLEESRKRPANVELRPDELATVKQYVADCKPALAIARTLVDYPEEGGRPLTIPPMPLDLDTEPIQQARSVAWVLQFDALAAAHESRGADGLRSARATLAAGRAIGDEPSPISQLVRTACAAVACRSAERVLGLTEPADGLAELQAELLREAEFPRLLHSFRAERASSHQIYRLMESGNFGGAGAAGVPGAGGGLQERVSAWAMRSTLLDNHIASLDLLTAHVEAGKQPFEKQWASLKAVQGPADGDRRYVFTNLLTASVRRIGEAGLRSRGDLLAAAAAIACERYRQRTGRWPDSLEAIPKDLLPAVPIDPFTGKPVRFLRLEDGIVVYTVGPDETDDDGAVAEDPKSGRKQSDFGMRLWDPAQRRQPAPPPGPKEEDLDSTKG